MTTFIRYISRRWQFRQCQFPKFGSTSVFIHVRLCMLATILQISANVHDNRKSGYSACCIVMQCVNAYMHKLVTVGDSLVDPLDLHLRDFQRVLVASPFAPIHTITVRLVASIQILAVQVGPMAGIVPPGTFVSLCTRVFRYPVVVLVRSAELHT